MPFPDYLIDPADSTVKSVLDAHERTIYNHSARLVQAGMAIESDRVARMIYEMATKIATYVANTERSGGEVSPHQIESIIFDMLDY